MSKKKQKDALERITSAMEDSQGLNIPREAVMLTILSVEIQKLENRIEYLEGQVDDLQTEAESIFALFL